MLAAIHENGLLQLLECSVVEHQLRVVLLLARAGGYFLRAGHYPPPHFAARDNRCLYSLARIFSLARPIRFHPRLFLELVCAFQIPGFSCWRFPGPLIPLAPRRQMGSILGAGTN